MTTIAVAIVKRAKSIWEAIQKRNHEPIYKTTKSNIAIAILKKLTFLKGNTNYFAF